MTSSSLLTYFRISALHKQNRFFPDFLHEFRFNAPRNSDIDFIVLKSYTIVRTYIVTAVQELA